MLPDSRIAGFSGNFRLARPRWLFSFGMGFVSNINRNMLFYSVLQSLGGASYVARITLARKFIIVSEINKDRIYLIIIRVKNWQMKPYSKP